MLLKSKPKIITRLVAIFLFQTVLTSSVYATFSAYEPFNYGVSIPNATASTASGFTGSWACGTTPTIATGLTYTGLSVANGSISSTSGRQSVNLLAPLASGTKWISFLFNLTGNNGGNICGIYIFPTAARVCFLATASRPFLERKAAWELAR